MITDDDKKAAETVASKLELPEQWGDKYTPEAMFKKVALDHFLLGVAHARKPKNEEEAPSPLSQDVWVLGPCGITAGKDHLNIILQLLRHKK